MAANRSGYSIIVPVRNEAHVLPISVPRLLAATAGDAPEIIYVCNGCTDESAALIRSLAGQAVTVIETSDSSKVQALELGDRTAQRFPRIYLDADIWLMPGGVARLLEPLRRNEADMVSPRLQFDLRNASWASRRMAQIWSALPYGREAAFQGVVGLSAAGRARWEDFPDVLGDDIFMAAMVPPHRRRIVREVTAATRPPLTFMGWVRARERWSRGERELTRLGLPLPRPPGQRLALLRLLVSPRTAPGAVCFITARLLGSLLVLAWHRRPRSWQPERATPRRARLLLRVREQETKGN